TTPLPTITRPIVWLASAPSRLSASLRPREAGLAALTGRSVEPCPGSYVMVGNSSGTFRERRNGNASTVDHAKHHGDDRPTHSHLLRVRHHGTGRTRFAGNGYAPCLDVFGRRWIRRGAGHAQRAAWASTGTTRARRRDGARLAASQVPRQQPSVASCGSGAR